MKTVILLTDKMTASSSAVNAWPVRSIASAKEDVGFDVVISDQRETLAVALFTNGLQRIRLAAQTVTEQDKSKDTAIGAGCMIAVLVIAVVGVGIYKSSDESGWISHDRETVIVTHTSWMNGESKTCYSYPMPPEHDVTKMVYCEGWNDEHNVKITFHGRTERPDAKDRRVSWKCIRRSDSFECYALD